MTDTLRLPAALCPICHFPPSQVKDDGHQAWCATPNCEVVMWDMHRYPHEGRIARLRSELKDQTRWSW
jgi:hypothetical protein